MKPNLSINLRYHTTILDAGDANIYPLIEGESSSENTRFVIVNMELRTNAILILKQLILSPCL